MKFTQAQQKIINKALELENQYGKGNVFLRYISEYFKIQFLIHVKGNDKIEIKLDDKNKINMKVLNSLMEKGLLTCCDSEHNENVDSNDRNINIIGSRIKTELINQ